MRYITTTLIILFSAISLTAQQAPLTLDISHNLDDNSGGVFDVEIRVSDFVELYTVQLFLKWNPDLFRIDAVPYVNADLPFFDEDSVILPAEDLAIPDDGKVRIVWANASTLSLPDNTHIVTLRFTAIGQPCEEAKFFFNDIGDNESEMLLAADVNFADIGITYDDMNVQIPGVDCTSSTGSLSAEASASIYPNPVSNILNVDLENINLDKADLSLYTQEGKLIKEINLGQSKNTISLEELNSGSYLYYIKVDDQKIKSGQLLKID